MAAGTHEQDVSGDDGNTAIDHGATTNLPKRRTVSPPGPWAQYVNKMLHTEPWSFLSYGLFWSCVLVVGCPLAGCVLLVTASWTGVKSLVRPRREEDRLVDARHGDAELGVYITGCDSGFGHGLACVLAARGFTVFPACLTDQGVREFERYAKDDPTVTFLPLQVDVTQDKDVAAAATAVRRWLEDKDTATRPRVLHGVVNNAGLGNIGLVDWVPLETFRRLMDVNFFGTVRTVKALLPLLKKQAYTAHDNTVEVRHRIVNVVSAAGLLSSSGLGGGAYGGSKHAAEAFTDCLRMELRAFRIPVVAVNPSWHDTPLSASTGSLLTQVWSGLSDDLREEYGEAYFSDLANCFLSKKRVEWDAKIVEAELLSCVESITPPPQVLVGSDTKYFLMVVRLLPMWAQVKVWEVLSPMGKAASMTKKRS